MLILGIAFVGHRLRPGPIARESAAPATSPARSPPRPAPPRNRPPPAARRAKSCARRRFYLLWVIYFIGAGAGLMVIGSISGMAKKSMGELAFVAVAVMAIGNAGGRILAGMLSDKIGRRWTLMLVLLIQAVLMFVAIPVTGFEGHGRRW